MDILDQAIEFEYSGHKLYTENAEKAQNDSVKFILNSLAEDELSHADFLKSLKAGQATDFVPSKSMPKIMNVIKESALNEPDFLSQDKGIIDVLQQALKLEDNARSHYTSEATQTLDENTRNLLNKLAKEEEQHYRLISNLIEHIKNPGNILESQEFQYYEK